ncbi:DUF418 domain-containing protein [uncultured Aquimonas sp.]|uniref:DUF418 domain-containing protein n=1 Tax=uncultured Aquimonas sp. TaxID=385483 RepID=UPI00086F8D39|nr:DUF418 domain-containing protein [uncultured Aquimonas sp.]ODU45536.1 MAG: hypothetical protein ABS96_14055 [Xanthomonadaceae bacterium SCN 69-123]
MSTPPPIATPRPPEDRLHLMDALRGFALLGILLMNIEFFNRSVHDYMSGIDTSPGAAGWAAWIVYVFVQGKFWVLFSLLFGMGFALMQDRLEGTGRPFGRLYFRRTLALMAFGLLHIVLLWPGDILFAYSITALMLMAFLKVRGVAVLITGLGLYFAVSALWVLLGAALGFMPEDAKAGMAEEMSKALSLAIESDRIYATGGYLEISLHRAQEYFTVMLQTVLMFQVPMALGVFLLGAWLLRSGRIQNAGAHLRFWTLTLLLGGLLGAFFVHSSLGVGVNFDVRTEMGDALLAAGLMALGNLPLSMAYLAAFVLLFQTGLGARVLGLLAPAGRMALTHYLLQSLVCSLLFYGYGLGWYGEVDRWEQVQVALMIFAAQVALSPLWLRHFRYGPLEWFWRGLTYGHLPALRKS